MPFELIRNDITKMNVDVIVNAANRSLLGGGGVDGAIHRAAGPELLAECRTLNGCATGEAKITKGYQLPARYVIHTVGPVWHGGNSHEKELLSACYRHSLELAEKYGCESIAFPMISAGVYGYPKDKAMAVAVDAITSFLLDHEMMVYLVVFGHDSFLTGKKLFREIKEYIDDVYSESRIRRREEEARRRLWREDEKAALDLDLQLSNTMPDESVICEAAPSKKPNAANAMASLTDLLKKTDEGFSQTLLRLIHEKGMTDAQCYKKANVDRKLFSKIRSHPEYKPSKSTVFAFAVALELTLPETQRLLNKAGFSLTHSNKFDIAMEFFITHKCYNIYEINEVLFEYDMPLLGSGMG